MTHQLKCRSSMVTITYVGQSHSAMLPFAQKPCKKMHFEEKRASKTMRRYCLFTVHAPEYHYVTSK